MTEERKQELEQLLNEAMESLVIRYGYGGPLSIPVDVYRKYLQERWTSYGVDFLSFWFSPLFMLDIVNEPTRSKLLDFIREELALFINRDYIVSVTYVIESNPTDRSRQLPSQCCPLHLYFILERLLEIAIGRGIEEAVSVFDRCSCPEGTHGFFQYIVLLEGISIRTEFQVSDGVRFIPLPSPETSEKLTQYLPGFPNYGSINLIDYLFGKTLLIINSPGFSIFYKPSTDPSSPPGFPANNLPYDAPPFQVEERDVRFPNFKVADFCENFCQALSLVYNSPVQIVHTRWFWEEDKSFNRNHDTTGMARHLSPFRGYTSTGETDIEEAKRLYDILVNPNSDVGEKLRIPIDRWIKSKAGEDPVDKIIDLGIAFESLYVSGKTGLSRQLRCHASWYLGENEEQQEELMTEFKAIYNCRCDAVHEGKLDEEVKVEGKSVPISEFIARAQDLCRESIMKILEAGEFPDWKDLILG